MLSDMFDEFGDDPRFIKVMENTIKKMVISMNNDLKFGDTDIENKMVGATLLLLIKNDYYAIEFLRTINLKLNANDETAYGNVNMFLNKIETLYTQAENDKMRIMEE